MTPNPKERVLFTEAEIRGRVSEIADQVSKDMCGGGPLLCLVVLRGGFFFAADLIRQLKGFERIDIDFVRLVSYAGMHSTGEVKIRGQIPPVAGCNILVIEDLLDTGMTMNVLGQALGGAGAGCIKYAVLVDKREKTARDVKVDYVAFDIDTRDYLYGYGMDIEGDKRYLPYIGAIQRKATTKR